MIAPRALQDDAAYLVQNLIWSGTKLLNSCNDKLWTKDQREDAQLACETHNQSSLFQGHDGEYLGKHTQKYAWLTMILQEMKLSDFNRENVTKFVSFVCGAIEQLRNNHALPTNVLWLISKALRECETLEFVSYITMTYNNHVQHVKSCSVDALMLTAKTKYLSMVSAKFWKAKATEQDHSAFVGITCYNCRKSGHIMKECPEKANSPGGHSGHGQGGGRGG